MPLAQTNLQLYIQARAAGYSADDILTLRKDYETACLLHAHGMRSSGKPLLCHLVGAASAVIEERQDLLLVRTMLNHAAYDLGRFPSGAGGMRDDHRRWLRERVGDQVHDLIVAYTDYKYSPEALARLASSSDALEGRERDLLVMRLCNEADDAGDYSAVLQRNPRWRDSNYFKNLDSLCERLGLDYCRDVFRRAAGEMADAEWLSPNYITGYFGFRQSAPRYIKSILVDWRRRFRKRS